MIKTRPHDEPGAERAWRIATSAVNVAAELVLATAPLYAAQHEVTPGDITLGEPQPNGEPQPDEEPQPDDTPWAVGAIGTCSRSQVDVMQA